MTTIKEIYQKYNILIPKKSNGKKHREFVRSELKCAVCRDRSGAFVVSEPEIDNIMKCPPIANFSHTKYTL